MKRFLLLSILFCIGIIQGIAQQTFTYTDANGVKWTCEQKWGQDANGNYGYRDTVTITKVENYGEEVVMPETVENGGATYVIGSLGGELFMGDKTLKKITLAPSVTTLESQCFKECTSLTTIGNTQDVTSVGYNCFYKCSNLIYIDLTACKTIDWFAFYDCYNLESVKLAVCKSIAQDVFCNCTKLKSINISSCETLGVSTFHACTSLQEVDLSNCSKLEEGCFESCILLRTIGSTAKLISIPGSSFYGCSSLETIDLSNCKSVGQSAFYGCKKLKGVNLSKCTYIGSNAFSSCESIENVDLSSVTNIEYAAFSNCYSLKSVVWPSKLTVIPQSTFAFATELTDIDLSKVTSIENEAFNGCKYLSTVNLPVCKKIGNNAFANDSLLKEIKVPVCTKLGYGAFMGCQKLETVDLPVCDSIADGTYYEDYNYGYKRIYQGAFSNCTSLKSINLPICKYIGSYAFANDSTITEINTPACDSISNYAFYNCKSIKNISFPLCQKIGYQTFSGCSAIETISLPVCEAIHAEAFNNCKNLKEVDLPKCKSIGDHAFESCTSLTKINLPLCEIIYIEGFANCSALETVVLPACTTIGDGFHNSYSNDFAGAFSNCSSLKSISLPVCKSIGTYAFANDSLLYNIDISKVESIGSFAFSKCPALEECALPETVKTIGTNAFDGNTILTITATTPPTYKQEEDISSTQPVGDMVMVKVPTTSVETYRSADGWKNIKRRIFGIDDIFDYDITTNAVATTSGIVSVIGEDNLQKVVSLKVKGSINGYDILVMRNKMDNLHYLDLADANVVANDNGYQYYEGASLPYDNVIGQKAFYKLNKLVTVKLPNTVRIIQRSAFADCQGLKSVELPKELIRIEDGYNDWTGNNSIPGGAFQECSNLQNVMFNDKLTYIGSQSFQYCSSLKDLNLPCDLDTIEVSAFENCNSLNDIILPAKLKTISANAFENCRNLTHVEFPPSLKSIGASAFRYSGLKDISLPGLENISDNAFYSCGELKEVKVPSTLRGIGQSAFEDCNDIEKVYSYTVEPINIGQNTFSCFDVATLYVPEQAKYNYYWETKWSQFKEIKTFNEPYSFFYVNKKYTLSEGARYDGCPNIEIGAEGEIGVEGSTMQDAGDIHIKGDGKDAGSLIASGNVNANNIYFDITINANRWYFFSFPFDIKRSDIQMKGSFVWRTYNGELRAQGNSGWTNLPASEEWLHRGQGYIFQASVSGTLTIKVDKSKFGNLIGETIQNKLQKHDASNSYDASWNFTGNPFTSYYDMNDLGYNAPITYWDENAYSYVAVRPGDDDYVFHPFQAFFVQKPQGVDAMEFNPDHRQGKPDDDGNQSMKAKRSSAITRGIDAKRMFINMKLSNGTNEDKTRIVFNEDKSEKYELDCDAAKFENGTEVVELYSIGSDNTRYAINERPKGDVKLGFKTTQKGTFTLGVERMDLPMILKDNLMNVTFDLSSGDYSFTSEKGTFNDRFTLTTSGTATGIADIMQQTGVSIIPIQGGINIKGLDGTKTVHIYSLNGTLLAEISNDGFVSLAQNVYVVKCEAYKAKLMVR